MKRIALIACIAALIVCGCEKKENVSPGSSDIQERTPRKDTASNTGLSEPMKQAQLIWTKIQIKQNCNLLTGCPLADQLMDLGIEARVFAARKLVGTRRTPHWRIVILRSLRNARDRRIQEVQHTLLQDKSWIIRSYAAIGLGTVRDPKFKQGVQTLLESERHPGLRTALLWACSMYRQKECREELRKNIEMTPDTQDIRIHLMALDAVRELRLVESLPIVRRWLTHSNLFVRRSAVRTSRALLDRPSIPALIQLLGQEETQLKTEVLDLLQEFTGLKHARDKKAFVQWCERYCLQTWPGRAQIND